jgi:hypothetical protein
MALADQLLKQAVLLVLKEPKHPIEASLRRAVSTAYYTVFHLLIEDACSSWARKDVRDYLARAFDHGTMKKASGWAASRSYPNTTPQVLQKLHFVARAFSQLQNDRHLADYSYATKWDRVKALAKVRQAEQAFINWKSIRLEYAAQRYLVSLLSPYKED